MDRAPLSADERRERARMLKARGRAKQAKPKPKPRAVLSPDERRARQHAAKIRWRLGNPDKPRENYERKTAVRRARSAERYDTTPFIAIDAEGCSFHDDVIEYTGIRYIKHKTFLWGAAGDDTRPVEWLGNGKAPLRSAQILDWLLSLPAKFGDAIFVSFGFNYDVTQILAELPREKVWEIMKNKTFPDAGGKSRPIRSAVLWRRYAIKYTKGKSLSVKLLRDPDQPYTHAKAEQPDGTVRAVRAEELDTIAHIMIYDTFGFYQEKFTDVIDALIKTGHAAAEERDFVARMKDARANFADKPLDEIKEYTTLELRLLARSVGLLRDGFAKRNLRLTRWSGAGSAASAMLKLHEVNKRHYPKDNTYYHAQGASLIQTAAMHAFFGGRIEIVQQGFAKQPLHVCDIASAYPAALTELPSMRNGEWSGVDNIPEFRSLAELRAYVEAQNILSMFQADFDFPRATRVEMTDATAKVNLGAERAERAEWFPFFPLPYRRDDGAILFPSSGRGWYMRDDILAAVNWLETFFPSWPKSRTNEQKAHGTFVIKSAYFFAPVADDGFPFSFLADEFRARRAIKKEITATGNYDIQEKCIKLCINSGYGKTAQSVGQLGQIPPFSNTWYAAATTAWCRRRVLEAACDKPNAIVFFATDGILSTEPLNLPRLKKDGDDVDLGDWEYNSADTGLFVQAGVYFYLKKYVDKEGEEQVKPVTKMRGASPSSYTKTQKAYEWMQEHVLKAWAEPMNDIGPAEYQPSVRQEFRTYVTAGAAVVSADRWPLVGRWSAEPGEPGAAVRAINCHSPGTKRALEPWHGDLTRCADWATVQVGNGLQLARRCTQLVRTRPASNKSDAMSGPRVPDWLDEDFGERIDAIEDAANAVAGF